MTVSDPDSVQGPNPQILGPIQYTGLTNLAWHAPLLSIDPGWGCCVNAAELVDGHLQESAWYFGYAWTGGTLGCGGGVPGWKQATIDLGRPQQVARADWWPHDANNVPTTWKVETSLDGRTFTEVFATAELRCRTATQTLNTNRAFPSCGLSARFTPVSARYVRYSFDDRTLLDGIHLWAMELEVFGP